MLLWLAGCGTNREDASLRIAVAGNFSAPARELARMFEEQSGIPTEISIGSTGQLFAQLTNGAPFDVFLSADQARAEGLVESGLAVTGSRFTYAVGKLVVAFAAGVDASDIASPKIQTVAIANPVTAPYGAAARSALDTWRWEEAGIQVITATNVAQAWQFLGSGAVDAAFVGVGQVQDWGGSWERVPDALYDPILQDAVLLRSSELEETGVRFLEFLRGAAAVDVISSFGYEPGVQ